MNSKIINIILSFSFIFTSVHTTFHKHDNDFCLSKPEDKIYLTFYENGRETLLHDKYHCHFCALHVRIAIEQSLIFLPPPIISRSEIESKYTFPFTQNNTSEIPNRGPPIIM